MNKLLFFISCFFLLSSCTEYLFRFPVPSSAKSLEKIPDELRGTFLCVEDSSTITTTAESYIRKDGSGQILEQGILGSDALLFKHGEGYLFNQKQSRAQDDLLWRVIRVTVNRNGFVLCSPVKDEGDTLKEIITEITTVEEVLNEDGSVSYFIIDPSPPEFKQLVGQNFFNSCYTFRRIMK